MNKILLSLVLVVACLTTQSLRADEIPLKWPSEFSVEMVTHASGQEIATKMFKGKDKTRMESNVQGMESVTIVRMDLKKMYMLMPAQKMVMEMPMNDSMVPDMAIPKGDVKWEKLGSETVNGMACDKYKVTATYEGKTSDMIYFLDSKGYPARTEITTQGQTVTVDYKNWSNGEPDAALFEVPADYNKMPGA